jgi:hypothetical protein
LLLGLMVSEFMSVLAGGVADANKSLVEHLETWSGFDLALCLGVAAEMSYSWSAAKAAGMSYSWSAAGLTAACLRKTVGDPAARNAGWHWPLIRC